MKRKITELIIILFFYIMQVSAARVISIANISPNWLIIMPVFFGFFCGKNDGIFMSRFILPEVVYTALVSLLIYHPIHYFCVITEQGKERKKKGKIDEGSI